MQSIRFWLLAAVCGVLVETSYSADPLVIASFNVQRFGETKSSDAVVMERLVQILTQYDVVLIMEVVDASGVAMERLMADLNAAPGFENKFDLQLSPRVGASTYLEAYAYIYRKDKVSVNKFLMYPDEKDIYARDPAIVQFSAGAEEFTLAGCHVAPHQVVQELNEMDNVYDYILKTFDTSRVLFMGDYNADCSYLSNTKFQKLDLNTRSEFVWLLPADEDSTVATSDCAYDRFISNQNFAADVSNAVVHRYDTEMQLSQDEAKAISDHYPIKLQLA